MAELLPDPAQQAGPQWAAYVGLEHALDAFFALELAVKALAHWRTPRGRPFSDRPAPFPDPSQGDEVPRVRVVNRAHTSARTTSTPASRRHPPP